MLKNIKDLSNLIKLENQDNIFKNNVFDILKIIKEETNIVLNKEDIFFKKNVFKIKTDSNIRFILFLHMKNLNKNVKKLNQDFILEL